MDALTAWQRHGEQGTDLSGEPGHPPGQHLQQGCVQGGGTWVDVMGPASVCPMALPVVSLLRKRDQPGASSRCRHKATSLYDCVGPSGAGGGLQWTWGQPRFLGWRAWECWRWWLMAGSLPTGLLCPKGDASPSVRPIPGSSSPATGLGLVQQPGLAWPHSGGSLRLDPSSQLPRSTEAGVPATSSLSFFLCPSCFSDSLRDVALERMSHKPSAQKCPPASVFGDHGL